MSDDERPERRLRISLPDLEMAFQTGADAGAHYLDLETGEVLYVPADMDRDAVVEGFGDLDPDSEEFAEAFEASDWLGWQVDIARDVLRIEAGFGESVIAVPSQSSREGYEDMEAFIDTVGDERLQGRLANAIRGRGAFHRFKETLSRDAAEERRWFEFRSARLRERILEWIESEDIEADLVTPSP